MFNLGVLTYEVLTGELPRGSFDPPSLRNPEVDSVVLRALRDRSEHRMSSGRHADALADARRMVGEADALAAGHPGSRAAHEQAIAHLAIAHALGYTGALEEAGEEYGKARVILRCLLETVPGDATYSGELADLDMSLGSNSEARGDFAAMLRHFTAWHEFVIGRYGRDTTMHSHSAFRMRVAYQKSGRAKEAIRHLKDAVRISERDAAAMPGHKGLFNHVSWCVRYLAQLYEDLGRTEEAAPLRRREAEVNLLLSAAPGE